MARFSGGLCATSSVFSNGCVFVGSGCASCMDFFMRIREFFLRRFRVSGAVVSGSVSSLLFLLLPPFFSWGRPGFLFSASLLLPAGQPWSTQAGPACNMPCFFSVSFALSARAGSPLPCPFSFSLSLSLSLACTYYGEGSGTEIDCCNCHLSTRNS